MARATGKTSFNRCDVSMSQPPLARPSLRTRLETAGGRRRDSVAISVLVGLLVFGGVGLQIRARAPLIAPPARAPEPSVSVSTAGTVFVHVAGAVRRPGLYEVAEGARIAEALEVAGGALPRARLSLLNLAEVLVDGSQILVPAKGAIGAAPETLPTAATTAAATVDLNVADQALLETIPGIGPVTATAILQHRTEIGSFTSLDQLLDVTGIGPATLESIRPYVSI